MAMLTQLAAFFATLALALPAAALEATKKKDSPPAPVASVSPRPPPVDVHAGPFKGPAFQMDYPETAAKHAAVQEALLPPSWRQSDPTYMETHKDSMASATIPRTNVESPDWVQQLVQKLREANAPNAVPEQQPVETKPEVAAALLVYKAAQAREKLLRDALARAEIDTKRMEYRYIDIRDGAEKVQRTETAALLRAKKGIPEPLKGDAHAWQPWANKQR